ncbi:BPI fold-containing family B member 6 [Suncus etruscus]|uniref:BPI fold-containing family B member 6 n=1 Tax=Suncus etruscus TaxID=109475 RepID=UPI002110AC8C|nr:BPI fold-containing family B member 6 [Suncus etruscus]
MLWLLCLALGGLLIVATADPGAQLRLGMDIMNREVRRAMDESQILEKMAAEASNNGPGMKAIKGIKDVKVSDVLDPVITLNFIPGAGISQCVSTGMTINGKSFMGGNMEIIIVMNITATDRILQDEETGLPTFKSEACEIILVNVKTNLPSNMLPNVVNKFLDSALHKILPGMLCPAIDAVLVYVNKKWANLLDPMPVGSMGTVKYVLTSVPNPTANYIQIDFSPEVQQQEGNTIALAEADVAPQFPEGYAEGSSQLLLSATFLTAELTLLQKSFDVKIKEKKIGNLPPQTTKTLAKFIPKMPKAYRKPKPLVTEIKINKPPKVTIKSGKSLLHLHGTLEMFAARRRGKPPVSLFLLDVHFNLKIQFSLSKNRLKMATSMNSLLSLSRVSSSVGDFNEEKLTDFFTDYLGAAYVPLVDDLLQVGLPLPNFLDMNYSQAKLDIVENALVLDLKLN